MDRVDREVPAAAKWLAACTKVELAGPLGGTGGLLSITVVDMVVVVDRWLSQIYVSSMKSKEVGILRCHTDCGVTPSNPLLQTSSHTAVCIVARISATSLIGDTRDGLTAICQFVMKGNADNSLILSNTGLGQLPASLSLMNFDLFDGISSLHSKLYSKCDLALVFQLFSSDID